jgi:hypothetical protein
VPYSAIDGNHLVQLMPHLVRPLTVVAVSSTVLLIAGTVAVAVLIALAILPLFFAIPLTAALFLGALAGGIISIFLGRWKPAQSHIPLPEKQGDSLSKLPISSSQAPLDFSSPQFPLGYSPKQVSLDSSPRQVSLGDGGVIVPETNNQPGADEPIREQTQEEICLASQIIQELLSGVEVLSGRVKDFQSWNQCCDEISGPWIGQVVRSCNGEIKDFLGRLCEQFANLKGQSVGHLQQLLSHFRKIVDSADPFWRLIAMDPTRQRGPDKAFAKRMPLIDFLEIVASGQAGWDLAWEWLELEEAGIASADTAKEPQKTVNDCLEAMNLSFPSDNMANFLEDFSFCNLPLRKELWKAMENIRKIYLANKRRWLSEKERGKFPSEMFLGGGLSPSEIFKTLVENIQTNIRIIRSFQMPLTAGEVAEQYNFLLEACVRETNATLLRDSHPPIDFGSVRIRVRTPVPHPAAVSSTALLTTITANAIPNWTEVTELFSRTVRAQALLKKISDNFDRLKDLLVNINAILNWRFNVTLAGKGEVSMIFRAYVPSLAGALLLRAPLDQDEETRSFQALLVGKTYVTEIQKNPNLRGRTMVYAAIGMWMQKYSVISPTFQATVLRTEDGREIIAMTPAGDRQLAAAIKNPNFFLTEKVLQTITWAQLLNFIAGQLDSNLGNFMVDGEENVRAIDPGYTFPSWEIGNNNAETLKNMMDALHKCWCSNAKSCICTIAARFLQHWPLIVELPPLMPEMRQMLEEIVSANGRLMVEDLLTANEFSQVEIEMTMLRLESIRAQLPGVRLVGKGGYRDLWEQKNSPLTKKNFLMRYFK